jgi:hypothetical protein
MAIEFLGSRGGSFEERLEKSREACKKQGENAGGEEGHREKTEEGEVLKSKFNMSNIYACT